MLGSASPRLGRTANRLSLPWGSGTRRTLDAMALAALLGAGVWFLIAEVASFRRVLHALDRASPGWLVAAFAAALVGYAGYALLYQALAGIADRPRPTFRLTLRLAVGISPPRCSRPPRGAWAANTAHAAAGIRAARWGEDVLASDASAVATSRG